MKKRVRDLLVEGSANLFDLPEAAIRDVTRVEIEGQRQICVERHRGIIEYGPETIAVNGLRSLIRVRGQGLTLEVMTGESLRITGEILAVELERT